MSQKLHKIILDFNVDFDRKYVKILRCPIPHKWTHSWPPSTNVQYQCHVPTSRYTFIQPSNIDVGPYPPFYIVSLTLLGAIIYNIFINNVNGILMYKSRECITCTVNLSTDIYRYFWITLSHSYGMNSVLHPMQLYKSIKIKSGINIPLEYIYRYTLKVCNWAHFACNASGISYYNKLSISSDGMYFLQPPPQSHAQYSCDIHGPLMFW